MTAVWVVVLVVVIALAYYGMWRGWRNRASRHDLPEPEWIRAGTYVAEILAEGTYVSTTTAGQWLDRVTAHGLGTIGNAAIGRDDAGLVLLRKGARSFRIPGADLVGVRRDRGIAGKVRDADGLVVVTWTLGGRSLDTGIRPRYEASIAEIELNVRQLIEGANHG